MPDVVTKESFLARIRKARADWESALATVPRARLLQPGFCGKWSAIQVVVHLAWYEAEMLSMLERKQFAGSDLWQLPPDDRNAAILSGHDLASPETELTSEKEIFARLMELLELLAQSDLNDPRAFPGMPLEWRPWQVLASNTYEHYEDHLAQAIRFHPAKRADGAA